ncbi:MAG TPA: hypothetical protein VH165_35260 [Kofleriaceae bacterium]|nr:hypothetical protein [Kofleriaceae bacterium]
MTAAGARAALGLTLGLGLGLGVCLGLGATGGLAAPAAAQSRRYPPAPVDKDAEDAAKSALWNAATNPERHPYQDLVHTAREALHQRTIDQRAIAIARLGEAIALLPHEAEAYRWRGEAYFDAQDWAACAADLAAADAYTQRDDVPPGALADLHRKLGICQAHAGKLADAETTLAETVTSGTASSTSPGETWMRLGEVRIAMGKLDEATTALRAALDSSEPGPPALTHLLLATAYDRARRPGDALLEASEGMRLDRALSTLYNPILPMLGPGDADYMLGLAFGAEPRPEFALAYFRRFVAAVPDSPWRRRAEEHIRDARAAAMPETVVKTGSAAAEPEALRSPARRAMPQLRACLARRPTVVVQLAITKAGPRLPAGDRTHPHFHVEADSIVVHRAVGELSDDELDAIEGCMKPIAARLALPVPHERDTYYTASFYVVGP